MKKKKILLINSVCYGSTGKIMHYIQSIANDLGYESLAIYGRGKGYDLKCEKFGNLFSFLNHVLLTIITDKHGFGSKLYTKKMIKRIRNFNPDIIYLHNIHGYYLNYPIFFNYLKKEYKGRIFWTLHDCWSFTGHCPHFEQIDCSKWKNQCYNCKLKKYYPISFFKDNSYNNYLEKAKNFTKIKNLTIITPSKWLEKLVKQSFLKEYDVKTIYNGVDTNVFCKKFDEKTYEKFNIPRNKKILISVSNIWDNSKGLNKYIEFSHKITNDYIIVLVGMKRTQISKLPPNIIGIPKVGVNDLVKLYSISYIFLNFTQADTFPTVNLEAISCGIPVFTLNTGGCKEQIINNAGKIIEYNNALDKIIKYKNLGFERIKWTNKFDKQAFKKNIIKLLEEGDE